MKKTTMLCLMLTLFAGSVFSQVNLCGKVTDNNGNPLTNTIVRLGQTTYDNGFGQNAYITKTDNAGFYHLGTGTCATTVYKTDRALRSGAFGQPLYMGGQVLFSLPQDNIPVTMGLYELTGRFVKEIVNSRLSKGNYSVRVDARALSTQYYCLRVAIGGESSVFKIQPLSRAHGAIASGEAAGFQTKLEKLAAVVDTLRATEPGYSLGVQPIVALTGENDFVLTKTSTWNGDTAAFWGNTVGYPTNGSYVILNRTNGAFADSKIYWSIQQNGAKVALSQQSTVSIPSGGGRFYIWIAPNDSGSRYFDFVEVNNPPWCGNTTRVDGWRLPIAFRLHYSAGNVTLGDAYEMFYQTRSAHFDEFKNETPKEFTGLAAHDFANIWAPHTSPVNIFGTGGTYVNYFTRYQDSVRAHNSGAPAAVSTVNVFACAGGGIGSSPDYSAAVNRHVGTLAQGTGMANWYNDTNYYKAPPCNYFSSWCHRRSIDNKCYGFPYDDDGGHAAYACQTAQWIAIAVGW